MIIACSLKHFLFHSNVGSGPKEISFTTLFTKEITYWHDTKGGTSPVLKNWLSTFQKKNAGVVQSRGRTKAQLDRLTAQCATPRRSLSSKLYFITQTFPLK